MSDARRILLWHGWLLEGSGSNVYASRTAEVFRRQGRHVLLLCQEPHPEAFGWIDEWGTCGAGGVSSLTPSGVPPAVGKVTLLRPDIGSLLPVFVYDEYEGFEVKRFLDLTQAELDTYLAANVAALRAAAAWHEPDVVVAGHVVPGSVIARRALGPGAFVAKVHGSDLEYAIHEQARYADLATEGLEGARAVAGATADVLRRAVEVAPAVAGRVRLVPPGVDVELFRLMPPREALLRAASLLDDDPDVARGRPARLDVEAWTAMERHLWGDLQELASEYDQGVPDPGAADRLRSLAERPGPIVGYFGKLIRQKGVDLMLQALALLPKDVLGLIVGFGTFREFLVALVGALDRRAWSVYKRLCADASMRDELLEHEVLEAARFARRVTFTGRLDHRYAPHVLSAMEVLVVPSILDEAFGMVAAEGAAAGALPLLARHSGLAEVAAALEGEVGRPGLFSFERGPGSVRRLAAGLDRLLALPAQERGELREAVSAFVAREWTWERTAGRLLEAAA